MEVKDGVLNHKFKNATNGLYAYNSLQNIEIAGNDTDNWNDDQEEICN
jgi:hypothetical protein